MATIREQTAWYIREDLTSTPDRPFPQVCYFVREREDLVYADKRVPAPLRTKFRDLADARGILNFWGQRIAVDYLMKLYDKWREEMALGFRTSVEQTHGYYPKLLLGDISQRGGGPIKIEAGVAHKTHQHGSQIDLYYLTRTGENKTVTCVPGKSDDDNNWNRDLNTRLLRLILKTGARAVLTECEPFFEMEEFRQAVSQAKIRRVPPHRDHFHVELG